MKYKKLLKKAAVSLLLAQSLIFTGLPIQAADIAGQSMVWTESVEMESAGDPALPGIPPGLSGQTPPRHPCSP